MATATRGVSVETVVSRRGDHHAVAVNVDIRRTRPAPGEVHRVPTLYCSHTPVATRTERDPGRRGRSHSGWVLAFDSFNG